VHHEVGAEIDRPLHVRTGKGVVDDDRNAVAMGDGARAGQVGQPEDGIGRRLEKQEPGRRPDRALDLAQLRRIHVGEVELVLPEHLFEQPIRAAVGVVGDDNVIAGLEERHHGAGRRHARREPERRGAMLHRREVGLERRTRGVLRAGVLVSLVHAKRVLHIGRCLVDGGDDGPGRRVWRLAGVDADGAETSVRAQLHGKPAYYSFTAQDGAGASIILRTP
jgi:hypothetical protein